MEMNTRIQVEHPVTEMTTGLDLIAEQIRIAQGKKLNGSPVEFVPQGHAIECRINAEDPKTYAPWPGLITDYHPPGGPGVRVDSGVYAGWRVPQHYDPMIMKLIVHAPTRERALAKMRRALTETKVDGIRTNISLHQEILSHPAFIAGDFSTRFLDELRKQRTC